MWQVSNDTFSPFVGHRHADESDPTATELFLEGLRSAQEETNGWNAVLVPALKKLNVARSSTTDVTITLPRVPTYDITVPETISLALPPAAVSSGQRILASPSFVVSIHIQ